MKKVFYVVLFFALVLSACGSSNPQEPEVGNRSQFNNHPLELVVEYNSGAQSFRVWKFSDGAGTTCYLTQNTEFRDAAIGIWCNQ